MEARLVAVELDPRGAETRALSGAVDLSAKRVLEIGAGDGRLTLRLAAAPRFVAGIEIDLGGVVSANGARSLQRGRGLSFLAASAMELPFRRRAFDVALLGWSL